MYCRFTHLEEGDPVPLTELGKDESGHGNYAKYLDSCFSALQKVPSVMTPACGGVDLNFLSVGVH
jgi:hypothetical protein